MATPASAPTPAPAPVAPSKPGVFLPWLGVCAVLTVSLGVHVVMDPISETLERLNLLKSLASQSFPEAMQGIVGEFLSWVMALGIQTPYGSVAGFIITGVVILVVVRPFAASLLGAAIGHPLLFLTGGTEQGWRFTWRAFAFNRIIVELASVACLLVVGYSPLKPAWQILILLFVLPGIRLIGMGALLAQIVKGQGVGFFRTFFLIGPVFALFTIASMLISFATVIWVGLWCIARVH
jgi:hypothetical protein